MSEEGKDSGAESVVPAKVETQTHDMDSRLRGNDEGGGTLLEKAFPAPPPPKPSIIPAPWRAYFRRRLDPLTSLVFTIPVFLIYHLGILLIDRRNGVDLVSDATFRLLDHSMPTYIVVTLAGAALISGAVWLLQKSGRLEPVAFLPAIFESAFWAVVMLFSIGWAVEQIFVASVTSGSLGFFDKIVLAAGAGFHEEVIFRVLLFAGGAIALIHVGFKPLLAWVLAGIASSLLFALIHHVGPGSDPFTFVSFGFRALAGVFLALIYRYRGFAVAVYTHAFYDWLVFLADLDN